MARIMSRRVGGPSIRPPVLSSRGTPMFECENGSRIYRGYSDRRRLIGSLLRRAMFVHGAGAGAGFALSY
jgi:hypothetical protein